jgi:hypothetical protein
MDTKQSEPQLVTHILDLRIGRLDLEEWDAIHRCDWSAARNISLKRAPLKEIRQWSAAPRPTPRRRRA